MAEFDPNQQNPSAESPQPPKKYVKRTAFFITATVIALLFLAAAVMESLVGVLRYIGSLLAPLIIGGIIAYLCNPIMRFYEYRVFRRMKKSDLHRGLSLFCTLITALGILALICAMMIPQLLTSITDLMANYKFYINGMLAWIQNFLDTVTADLPVNIVDISDMEKLTAYLNTLFGDIETSYASIFETIQTILTEGNVLEKTWATLLTLFNSIKNLFLGLFIAFYLLASKEKRYAQVAKFSRAVFKEKTDSKIGEIISLAHETFGGFLYGKIIDSLVIGVLTFVMLAIFEISPYNLLIATFVGITNIIPVFGPFIGAIPSFFVVLISNPDKAILFLVLILIIQQIDGNIIGPKILGDNTGVSSLCVIIAISICSTLWGVAGMIIGVPIFAVVIELVRRILENRLAAKGEPTDTQAYYPVDAVGDAEKDVRYEHASLRYTYEHSRLRPVLLRMRTRFFKIFGRQSAQDIQKDEVIISEILPDSTAKHQPSDAEESNHSESDSQS